MYLRRPERSRGAVVVKNIKNVMENNILLQVGVKALLKNKEDKFLLLHRSLEKYPEVTKNRWDIVGGRIDPGSDLMTNLDREIMEETGQKMTSPAKLIAAQDILRVKGKHIVRLTYIADIDGEITIDPEEHDDYRWFSLEEIRKRDDVDLYFMEILNNGTVENNL